MRRQNGLPSVRRLHFLFVAAMGFAGSGCEEEFSDEPFSVLDLVSVYDGGTRNDPAGGLPTSIDPSYGFLEGEYAQYYDFGFVPYQQDSRKREPTHVVPAPMYFFFDRKETPLFSRPVREERTATDWMRGGKRPLNPNPQDFCAAATKAGTPCSPDDLARNRMEKERPYPVRHRDVLVDPVRQSPEYQRPIVDVTPADREAGGPQYTGLWEIVEIVAPSGYDPDAIKHAGTLAKAVASGKFKRRATGKVINCPMIDERTFVTPGVTDLRTPRPRVELWYRRKLAFCFLADGWETLGNQNGELYFANQDHDRLDTFDVERLQLGQGKTATTRVVVPVGRAYLPTIYTNDGSGFNPPQMTTVADNIISAGRPRRFPDDPPGYTPIRWLFEMPVPSDYRWGGLKRFDEVDLSHVVPRGAAAGQAALVHNLPVRGALVACSPDTPRHQKGNQDIPSQRWEECGKLIDRSAQGQPPLIDPSGDPVCNKLGLECNRFSCYCEEKIVRYGERCAPAVAQCDGPPRTDAAALAKAAEDPFAPLGYGCFPSFGGHCYKVCDSRATNTFAEQNMGKKATQLRDSRCDGVPGYSCYGFCLRNCDQNVTNVDQCSAKITVESAGMSMERDVGAGQTCQDWGVQVCTWPESYEASK